MMNGAEKRIHVDEGDGDGVDLDLYAIRGGNIMQHPVRTRSHRAHGTEHELKRMQFAVGPGASHAAHMLEQAFGLRPAASVIAEFAPRTLRCVKHRFDQGVLCRDGWRTDQDAL